MFKKNTQTNTISLKKTFPEWSFRIDVASDAARMMNDCIFYNLKNKQINKKI